MTDERYQRLTAAQAAEQTPPGWRVDGDTLVATYRTGSMVRGLAFVDRIVAAAEADEHHPDIDFRYATVALTLTTHATGGLTDADVRLARAIGELADGLELTAEQPNS
ncbi:4a-hydroxytetrahydrobiopterin dehydratase [Gordonia caeni]|uniref:Putative pterin-4-alpha-carbinolamine dehydratase n=1 Tax=Gordonia caeni TaxID=1007097 RepID=A0ABP7PVJ5_9ACTN